MAENKFDIIIIGGGPGGYNAAERAAHGGLKTALFEERALAVFASMKAAYRQKHFSIPQKYWIMPITAKNTELQ